MDFQGSYASPQKIWTNLTTINRKQKNKVYHHFETHCITSNNITSDLMMKYLKKTKYFKGLFFKSYND
uniref:Uncharacterized protein n=1 Tax=Heterorhabditis bacteriophora TaxID=37862 RepID=A0A1I7WI64_HETBA